MDCEDAAIAAHYDACHGEERESADCESCGEPMDARDPRSDEDGRELCSLCSREWRPIRLHANAA